jgi:hypothetical protein
LQDYGLAAAQGGAWEQVHMQECCAGLCKSVCFRLLLCGLYRCRLLHCSSSHTLIYGNLGVCRQLDGADRCLAAFGFMDCSAHLCAQWV